MQKVEKPHKESLHFPSSGHDGLSSLSLFGQSPSAVQHLMYPDVLAIERVASYFTHQLFE